MPGTQLSAIDTTVQKTRQWINEIMSELDWDDPDKAYAALRIVLQALRDRLSVDEATDLASQLPTLIRGIYFESWKPRSVPVRQHSLTEFLAPVAQRFSGEPSMDSERICRSVMKVLASHVSEGEIDDIKACLPEEIRDLWN
ncbi:MAG: DUF2267 domain-containing protein [Pirellulaceae bacterium]